MKEKLSADDLLKEFEGMLGDISEENKAKLSEMFNKEDVPIEIEGVITPEKVLKSLERVGIVERSKYLDIELLKYILTVLGQKECWNEKDTKIYKHLRTHLFALEMVESEPLKQSPKVYQDKLYEIALWHMNLLKIYKPSLMEDLIWSSNKNEYFSNLESDLEGFNVFKVIKQGPCLYVAIRNEYNDFDDIPYLEKHDLHLYHRANFRHVTMKLVNDVEIRFFFLISYDNESREAPENESVIEKVNNLIEKSEKYLWVEKVKWPNNITDFITTENPIGVDTAYLNSLSISRKIEYLKSTVEELRNQKAIPDGLSNYYDLLRDEYNSNSLFSNTPVYIGLIYNSAFEIINNVESHFGYAYFSYSFNSITLVSGEDVNDLIDDEEEEVEYIYQVSMTPYQTFMMSPKEITEDEKILYLDSKMTKDMRFLAYNLVLEERSDGSKEAIIIGKENLVILVRVAL